MTDNWGDETRQGYGNDGRDNYNREKPVYSQSFSRGGRGNRFNRSNDRGSNFRQTQNDSFRNYQGNGFADNNSNECNGKVLHIDSRKVGSILGRGGSKVKEMEQNSGARINVSKDNVNDQREVVIKGSPEAIESAYQLIQKALNESNDYHSQNNPNRRNFNSQQSDRQYNREDNSTKYNTYQSNRDEYSSNYQSNRDTYSNKRESNNLTKRNYDDFSEDQSIQNNCGSNRNNYQNTASNEPSQDDKFEPIDWDKLYREADEAAAARLASLPKIVKKLYVEDPEVANMTSAEVSEFRLKNMQISVSRIFAETEEQQVPIPNPIKTFEHAFKPYPEILDTIYKQEFKTPSPIQCQAWPVIMSGEDLIGIAQTGTGKTLAFLLPAMIHIESQFTPRSERVGPTVLILSPTRELALQIEKEINKYSYRDIKCVCVYGGGNRRDQINMLQRSRPEIIVATPGRLDDFLQGAEIQLDSVTYVVLDEADKMLEMGFECQIRKILINVRSDRQSIMTSATWPSGVRRLASQYSNNPIQVVVGSLDLAAVHSVSQHIEIIDEDDKRAKLDEFLRNMEPDDKVIVFCGKKCVTDDICSDLTLHGVRCQSLHGDREQYDREQALQDLKTGEVHILIATDVAARGLDVADITHVFNFDFPKNIEEYVHRIGRTGRAGRTGISVSLFTRRDWANAADLIKILEEANQGVPEELIQMAERFEKRQSDGPRGGRGGGGGRGFRGGFGRDGGGGGRDNRSGGRGGGGRGFGGGRNRY